MRSADRPGAAARPGSGTRPGRDVLRGWLLRRVPAVVVGAAPGVAEQVVGVGERPEPGGGPWVGRAGVGMRGLRRPAVGARDVLPGGAGGHAEHLVGVTAGLSAAGHVLGPPLGRRSLFWRENTRYGSSRKSEPPLIKKPRACYIDRRGPPPRPTTGWSIVAERPAGTFTRQVFLGDTLDADHIDADYTAGVLTLAIPVHEAAKPRKVEITSQDAKQITPA
jgi:Hsp20/alpha crystallin family